MTYYVGLGLIIAALFGAIILCVALMDRVKVDWQFALALLIVVSLAGVGAYLVSVTA